LEIDWARSFGFREPNDFLHAIAFHLTTGNSANGDYADARQSVQSAMTRTLWDNYRISRFDRPDDEQWGELNVNFRGAAFFCIDRRDAPARRSR
jgi:hypothetical protein